jgi:omega-hydroxy-beta-dihydromenaquinone-9 sulfotransferase
MPSPTQPRPPSRSLRLPAVPYPHFMAFAPLDAWARMLGAPPARVPPRYWLRLAAGLFTSALGTALTLPERVVLGPLLWWKAQRNSTRLAHEPGTVVILGYYRSGTTHLHYLLSCDPQFRTPRWCEALAPQGFYFSWLFLRIFLIPFISARRPQDDVAIGPEWPAEDDFAICNWTGASSLPGRFVVPQQHAHYARFHSLEGLTEAEHRRWRRTLWAFCWKLSQLAGHRRLLLKTPSHTARVRELVDLFGPGRVKFIHIRRDPEAVIRSNIAMHGRLHVYNLQDPPPADEIEPRLLAEYARTDALCQQQTAQLDPGDIAEIRYDDLVRDPLGCLRSAYLQLDLEWTPGFERGANAYLASVRHYRAATPANTNDSQGLADSNPLRGRVRLAIAAGLAAAILVGAAWVAQAYMLSDRNDWLVWPAGVVVGLVVIRTARVGSAGLGIFAATLTLVLFAAVVVPATFVSDYFQRPYYRGLPMREWEWYHILKSSRVGALATNNIFWLFMGILTAYRFASRKHVRPPGS